MPPEDQLGFSMAQLFDPARHVPLGDASWSEAAAREAIRSIAADACAAFDPETLWPGHPLDAPMPDGSGCVYMGAAGVVWALDHLEREGAAEIPIDFAPALPRMRQADQGWLGNPPFCDYASLLLGDLGPMLVAMRLAPSPTLADEIFVRLGANDDRPLQDLMWGTAGSLMAARWMQAATGQPRFAELWRRQAARLLDGLQDFDGALMWSFDLYGQPMHMPGLVHGFAGNMLSLIKGWDWLEASQKARVESVSMHTLTTTARWDGGMVNWPTDLLIPAAPLLCQVCHGASGIVMVFAEAPFQAPEFERLLASGGETIWTAGPLAKGSNICHGTGGSGRALLRLYDRTGDARWLDRARRLAMAAIAQCDAAREEYGRGRYSLWTGDPGLAVFLWECIITRPAFPGLDRL
jgi:hypothetical protein